MKDFEIPVWRGTPISRLTLHSLSSCGRNNLGRVTVNHRVGVSRRYRIVDFRRILRGIPACVIRLERDPFRNAPLALLCYSNGVLSYILASKNLHDLRYIFSSNAAPIEPSNCLLLRNIPIGTHVFNIEPRQGLGGVFVRSGGMKSQILRKTDKFSIVRLPSGELRYIHSSLSATIGTILSPHIFQTKLRKAGQSMWLGHRPVVRGVAMNPIDHPHGGGEGKTSGADLPCLLMHVL